MSIITRAVYLSARENRIVHLDYADLEQSDMDDLLCACEGNGGIIDAEQGSEEEFWGTTDGAEWRVHVGPTGGCYDHP